MRLQLADLAVVQAPVRSDHLTCRHAAAPNLPPLQSRQERKQHVAANPLPKDVLGDVFK